MPVPDMERRKSHIDLIEPENALLPIANDCLDFHDEDRPSSEELCSRILSVKESRKYRGSMQQQQDDIQAKERQISLQAEQLQSKENEILSKDDQLREKVRALEQKQYEFNELDRLMQEKESQHQEEIALRETRVQQLSQQLTEQQEITAELQHANISLQKQVERLDCDWQCQARMRERQLPQRYSSKQPPFRVDSSTYSFPHKAWEMTLNWKGGGKAPFKMTRGAAVVNGDVAYFMDCSGVLCSYSSTSMTWRELPKYPYEYGSLAIINGELTAIGGCSDVFEQSTYTNKLLSLHKSWANVFPPMPTKRRSTTTIATTTHIIVAGGTSSPFFVDITTVEVLDTQSLAWSSVASLPHPYNAVSATICERHLYVLGGFNERGKTKSVLICLLTELVQSSSSSSSVWHRIADAPVYRSTCATIDGALLAVGGCSEGGKAKSKIHKYNGKTNSWDLISNMPTARYNSLIVTLPNNEMMVLGGTAHRYNTRKVEIGFS